MAEVFSGQLITHDVLKVSYIPSVNSAYIRARNRIILSPEARKTKKEIVNQLGASVLDKGIVQKYVSMGFNLQLNILFLLHPNNGIRDTDNMIKIVQDAVQEYYNFNDKYINDLYIRRRLHDIYDEAGEYIIIKLFANKHDMTIKLNESNQ